MDVLAVLVEARVLAVAAPPRAFAGVPVRDVEALDVAVFRPNCFVGDLVGDCISSTPSVKPLYIHNWEAHSQHA